VALRLTAGAVQLAAARSVRGRERAWVCVGRGCTHPAPRV
jgi:hypothetical protein